VNSTGSSLRKKTPLRFSLNVAVPCGSQHANRTLAFSDTGTKWSASTVSSSAFRHADEKIRNNAGQTRHYFINGAVGTTLM